LTRYLHVINSVATSWGGTTRAVADIARMMVEHGDEVVLASVDSSPDPQLEPSAIPSVQLLLFESGISGRVGGSRSFRRYLRANVHTFDVVIIHNVWTSTTLYAAEACIRAGRPYVVHPHASLDPYDVQKHRLLKSLAGRLLIRRVLANAAAIVCHSRREAETLVDYGAGSPRAVVALPVYASTVQAGRDAARDRLGLEPDEVAVLHLGRLDPKKGLERVLRAAQHLDRPVRLLIAGTGQAEYVETLKALAVDAGLADRCRWLGHVDGLEKAELLAASDIFVLASQMENFGIAVVEAAQSGLPMILSEQVYIASDFAEAGGALQVGGSDEDVLAGLRTLVENRSMRRSLGVNARLVAERYRPSVVGPSYASMLRDACTPARVVEPVS
jgi:glycosyltransferase involved in cell wall biosynthesis